MIQFVFESHTNINSPMIEIARRKVRAQRKSLIFATGRNAPFFSVGICWYAGLQILHLAIRQGIKLY